jgi:hypothetical protein
MKQLIGFATKFYTLWNYEKRLNYVTDSYGKHHISGYTELYYYIKNISTDLDKVKNLYPNVQIDDELRGKNRDWEKETNLQMPEGYFWVGKYKGRLIDEIIEIDFDYCLWAVENMNDAVKEYIKKHPKYLAHIDKIKAEEQELLSEYTLLKQGDVIDLLFTTNGRSIFANISDIKNYYGFDHPELKGSYYVMADYGGVEVKVEIDEAIPVGLNTPYPYFMPVINGKSKRTKGKVIKVKVSEIIDTIVNPQSNTVKQRIKIASI